MTFIPDWKEEILGPSYVSPSFCCGPALYLSFKKKLQVKILAVTYGKESTRCLTHPGSSEDKRRPVHSSGGKGSHCFVGQRMHEDLSAIQTGERAGRESCEIAQKKTVRKDYGFPQTDWLSGKLLKKKKKEGGQQLEEVTVGVLVWSLRGHLWEGHWGTHLRKTVLNTYSLLVTKLLQCCCCC